MQEASTGHLRLLELTLLFFEAAVTEAKRRVGRERERRLPGRRTARGLRCSAMLSYEKRTFNNNKNSNFRGVQEQLR